MRIKINALNASVMGNSIVVNMIIPRAFENAVQTILDAFKDKKYGVFFDISLFKEKRSLNANNLMWHYADELAKKLRTTKEEVYRYAIRHVGVFYELTFKEPQMVEEFEKIWKKNGTGWIIDKLDETTIHAYKGSSVYRTDEMSRLIDFIQQECIDQGIEIRPKEEVDALLASWKVKI